jgi:hypothetical protein
MSPPVEPYPSQPTPTILGVLAGSRVRQLLLPGAASSQAESEMFDLERFIDDCGAVVSEDSGQNAVREIVARAVSDPSAVIATLGEPEHRNAQRCNCCRLRPDDRAQGHLGADDDVPAA